MSKQVIYGLNTVISLLKLHPDKVLEVLVARKDIPELGQLSKAWGIKLQVVSKDKLDKITGTQGHQGVAATMHAIEFWQKDKLESFLKSDAKKLILVLEQIQDPNNFGACLRSAAAFGVDLVIITAKHSCPMTAAVHKVAVGTSFLVPIYRCNNLAQTLALLKQHGVFLFASALGDYPSLRQTNLCGQTAIIMGNEGQGIRHSTKEHSDFLFTIPMQPQVESLNIASATSLCLYEAYCQRLGA